MKHKVDQHHHHHRSNRDRTSGNSSWKWFLSRYLNIRKDKPNPRSLLFAFSLASVVAFLFINKASRQVIDEEFHLRQGLHYCHGNFSVWDNKITTFPGLYLVSSFILTPFGLCTPVALRLVSLVALNINLYLIYLIRSLQTPGRSDSIGFNREVVAIASLPPMFFFGHLYYTDILSITSVLAMMLAFMRRQHNVAALCGVASVLMRQTNIVWVGMFLGLAVLEDVVKLTKAELKLKSQKFLRLSSTANYNLKEYLIILWVNVTSPSLLLRQCRMMVEKCYGYLTVLAAFVAFVLWNGSIVVGDKSAHEAAIHLPQIFYFNLFTLIFGYIAMPKPTEVLQFVRRHWLITLLVVVTSVPIVALNTLVHPYLLADNRHYTFYAWNRFYGKYWWARYAALPVFWYATLSVASYVKRQKFPFDLMFVVCAFVQLALQRMIEVRYFLVPFLMLRLRAGANSSNKEMTGELLFNVAVNFVTICIFCTKEIHWDNFEEVQRLIW